MQTTNCPVNETRVKLEQFYHDDSKNGMCSKCHPCKLGLYDAIQILTAIQAGKGLQRHIGLLKRIAQDVKDGGMCKKGKDHADILGTFLTIHAEDLCRHVRGICDDQECGVLTRYEVDADRCTRCDACRVACPSAAIEGQKQEPYKTGFMPYRIRQKRCTHCGECMGACPEGAIFVGGVGAPLPTREEAPVAAAPEECREVLA